MGQVALRCPSPDNIGLCVDNTGVLIPIELSKVHKSTAASSSAHTEALHERDVKEAKLPAPNVHFPTPPLKEATPNLQLPVSGDVGDQEVPHEMNAQERKKALGLLSALGQIPPSAVSSSESTSSTHCTTASSSCSDSSKSTRCVISEQQQYHLDQERALKQLRKKQHEIEQLGEEIWKQIEISRVEASEELQRREDKKLQLMEDCLYRSQRNHQRHLKNKTEELERLATRSSMFEKHHHVFDGFVKRLGDDSLNFEFAND